MGNFAENLNLGNRFRPPLPADILPDHFSFDFEGWETTQIFLIDKGPFTNTCGGPDAKKIHI